MSLMAWDVSDESYMDVSQSRIIKPTSLVEPQNLVKRYFVLACIPHKKHSSQCLKLVVLSVTVTSAMAFSQEPANPAFVKTDLAVRLLTINLEVSPQFYLLMLESHSKTAWKTASLVAYNLICLIDCVICSSAQVAAKSRYPWKLGFEYGDRGKYCT